MKPTVYIETTVVSYLTAWRSRDLVRAAQQQIALLAELAIPSSSDRDAAHVAIAATNGIDYLLTWNCRHLANLQQRGKIEQVCREHGYNPPLIGTPNELREEAP